MKRIVCTPGNLEEVVVGDQVKITVGVVGGDEGDCIMVTRGGIHMICDQLDITAPVPLPLSWTLDAFDPSCDLRDAKNKVRCAILTLTAQEAGSPMLIFRLESDPSINTRIRVEPTNGRHESTGDDESVDDGASFFRGPAGVASPAHAGSEQLLRGDLEARGGRMAHQGDPESQEKATTFNPKVRGLPKPVELEDEEGEEEEGDWLDDLDQIGQVPTPPSNPSPLARQPISLETTVDEEPLPEFEDDEDIEDPDTASFIVSACAEPSDEEPPPHDDLVSTAEVHFGLRFQYPLWADKSAPNDMTTPLNLVIENLLNWNLNRQRDAMTADFQSTIAGHNASLEQERSQHNTNIASLQRGMKRQRRWMLLACLVWGITGAALGATLYHKFMVEPVPEPEPQVILVPADEVMPEPIEEPEVVLLEVGSQEPYHSGFEEPESEPVEEPESIEETVEEPEPVTVASALPDPATCQMVEKLHGTQVVVSCGETRELFTATRGLNTDKSAYVFTDLAPHDEN